MRVVPTRVYSMLGLLLVVAATLYYPVLGGPFHFDDHHSIRLNPHLQIQNTGRFFSDPTLFSADPARAMYRPMVLASYAVTGAWSGEETWSGWLHLQNALLHALAALMVWGLVRSGATEHSDTRIVAVLASLGFLVHPLTSETALYISARAESMSVILALATILLWRQRRHVPAIACYALALSCKSTALVTPILMLGLDRLWPSSRQAEARSLAGFAAVAVGYIVWMKGLIHSSLVIQHVRTGVEQCLVQVYAWVYQLKLLVTAQPLSIIHPVGTVAPTAGHLVAIGFLVSLGFVISRSRTWILACLVVSVPLAIPTVIPLHTVISEHRLYLMMAVLAAVLARGLGVAALAHRLHRRRFTLLAGFTLVAWGLMSSAQGRVWATEEGVWRQALAVSPASPRVHEFYGDVLRRQGRLGEAFQQLRQADSLYGGRLEVQLSMSGILLQQNQLNEAHAMLAALRTQYPDDPQVLYNLALSLEDQPVESAALLERVVELRPAWKAASSSLALIQEELGRPSTAITILERILGQAPEWLEGWVNVGYIKARQGDLSGAREAWEHALSLAPGERMIRENLAELTRVEATRRSQAHP